ncbi:DUF397 domain-containing protein [Streptomyces olivoreticuli]|uniref:DUF397 domain-containing protein n=1 Tax=Streptomyces olivoreticuli TaxID=68246 RepID=UPI000E24D6CC|nr:DUF397 domain-containing protein [Streptomyces olivoreticuli]
MVAPEGAWFKSSYSGSGNACVELADLTGQVGVRDSKWKTGPALVLASAAWATFLAEVQRGGWLGNVFTD